MEAKIANEKDDKDGGGIGMSGKVLAEFETNGIS